MDIHQSCRQRIYLPRNLLNQGFDGDDRLEDLDLAWSVGILEGSELRAEVSPAKVSEVLLHSTLLLPFSNQGRSRGVSAKSSEDPTYIPLTNAKTHKQQ